MPLIGKWHLKSPPNGYIHHQTHNSKPSTIKILTFRDLINLGDLLLLIDPPPHTHTYHCIGHYTNNWKRPGYLLTTIGMGRVRMKMPQSAHKPPINLPGKVDGESSP